MALFSSSPSPFSLLRSIKHSPPSKSLVSETSISTITARKIYVKPSVSVLAEFPSPSSQRLRCCTSSSSSIEHDDECHSTGIFIKGLPQSTSEGSLKNAFSQFGEVNRGLVSVEGSSCIRVWREANGLEHKLAQWTKPSQITGTFYPDGIPPHVCDAGRLDLAWFKVVTDKRSKQSLGFAYIWYTSEEAAKLAVREMNGKFFEGRFVYVTTARPGPSKSRVKTTPYRF